MSTNITTKNTNKGAAPVRYSRKILAAIEIIASTGKTQAAAAKQAGVSQFTLSRALAEPKYRSILDNQKALFAEEIAKLEGRAKHLAIHRAIELMHEGPPAIQARMIELLAGSGSKGVTVNVQNNVGAKGYEYIPPGAQVVDIVPSRPTKARPTDAQSVADTPQDPENIGD